MLVLKVKMQVKFKGHHPHESVDLPGVSMQCNVGACDNTVPDPRTRAIPVCILPALPPYSGRNLYVSVKSFRTYR